MQAYLLPNLDDLCGDWFFEGWQATYLTAQEALQSFVKAYDLPTTFAAIDEIDQVLRQAPSEAALRNVLCDILHCCYDPTVDGIAWGDWLRWAQRVLQDEIEAARGRRVFSRGPDRRILHFPTERAVGTLRRYDPDEARRAMASGPHVPSYPFFSRWEFFGYAQGEVVVPQGIALALEISRNGSADPSPFPVGEPPIALTPEVIERMMHRTNAEILAQAPHRPEPEPVDLAFLHDFSPDDLHGLFLTDTTLVGDGLAPLARLTGLRALTLFHRSGTDADLAYLRHYRQLEALQVGFGRKKISDVGLRHLDTITTLRVLSLDGASVTDLGLRYLSGCTHMEELHLDITGVGNANLEWIEDMRGLWRLNLFFTQVTRAGLARLRTLSGLRWLAVSSPFINEGDRAALRLALPLCKISEQRIG